METKCSGQSYRPREFKIRRRIWNNRLKFLLVAVVGLASCAGEVERQKLAELKRIANQTPVCPGFVKVSERDMLRRGKVAFSLLYQSNAQFADVKTFYDRVLKEQGWGPPEQPPPSIIVGEQYHVTYRKGDYAIDVGRDNSRHDHFGVTFEWNP